MKKEFKTNDWCFCEFKLSQIQRMEEGRITSISDGNFNHGSFDLSDRCYPLDLRIKRISDSVAYHSDQFHKSKANLNHPDLHRKLVQLWVNICEVATDDAKLKEEYDKLTKFCNSVQQIINSTEDSYVDDFRVFR